MPTDECKAIRNIVVKVVGRDREINRMGDQYSLSRGSLPFVSNQSGVHRALHIEASRSLLRGNVDLLKIVVTVVVCKLHVP